VLEARRPLGRARARGRVSTGIARGRGGSEQLAGRRGHLVLELRRRGDGARDFTAIAGGVEDL
jgi:hypothetical protein